MILDRHAHRRAVEALEAGRPREALGQVWGLVDRSHLDDDALGRHLRLMVRCYREAGLDRAAATVLLYLGEAAEARGLCSDVPTDQARCALVAGDRAAAARQYTRAGWLGHAALVLEDAGDLAGARVSWERLAGRTRAGGGPYVAGLVQFNLARVCRGLGDATAARRALGRCVNLLEAAADELETRGLRERAFDCFQVILTLGRDGAFENLAEGYLNCIRILSEDNLRYYALQYYEDFHRAALERGELRAAATLATEAANFARRHGLRYEGHYRLRAARAYVAAAERAVQEGAPLELAENAYAAAVATYTDLGQFERARELYALLAALPLAPDRRARYERLERLVGSLEDEEVRAIPLEDHLRMETAYPEIWRHDVIEHEQGGDPAETMGEVLLDPRWPAYTRRLALLCRLEQLGADPDAAPSDTWVGVAARLGRVGIYPALAPLESLYAHDDPRVRAASVRALRDLFFKRSFELVMRALSDDSADVRREAVAAVRSLHFVHAFDPLARIYRGSTDPEVRRAALESIGRIDTREARDLLDEVARHGAPKDRPLAQRLLHPR